MGTILRIQQRYHEAMTCHVESKGLYAQTGSRYGLCTVTEGIGTLKRYLGDREGAIREHTECLNLARQACLRRNLRGGQKNAWKRWESWSIKLITLISNPSLTLLLTSSIRVIIQNIHIKLFCFYHSGHFSISFDNQIFIRAVSIASMT